LITLWLPFVLRNPRRIRFIFPWLSSLKKGKSPLQDRLPLIPFEAKEWLESFLTKNMNVFEWGSGGSTLFIAKRIKKLISVEHDLEWYITISKFIKEDDLSNCKYIFKKPESLNNDSFKSGNFPNYFSNVERYKDLTFEDYCKTIESYPDNFFDLVFVDGRARPSCIFHALNKIRPGGFLMLDDSERKQYSQGTALLKGWEQKDFLGPRPYKKQLHQTSIWRK